MNAKDLSSVFKRWAENDKLARNSKTTFEQRDAVVTKILKGKGVSPITASRVKTDKALASQKLDPLGYKIAELIAGGDKGMSQESHKQPSQVDPKELAAGIKIEREHSDNPKVQKEIAMDHLTEHPKYYTGLKKMEAELTKAEKVMHKLSAKKHSKDCPCEECEECKESKKHEAKEKHEKKK